MTSHMFPMPGEKSFSNSIAFQVPLSLTAHTSPPFSAFPGAQERTWGCPRKIRALHTVIISLCPKYSQRGEKRLGVSKGKTLAAAELGDIAFS